jgi:hypothetical protein
MPEETRTKRNMLSNVEFIEKNKKSTNATPSFKYKLIETFKFMITKLANNKC